jgi:hypothetical protein
LTTIFSKCWFDDFEVSTPDVALEVFKLPDLTPVLTDNLVFCTPSADYELNPGDYHVKGTATATGDVREINMTIKEGTLTTVDLNFAPPTPPIGFLIGLTPILFGLGVIIAYTKREGVK